MLRVRVYFRKEVAMKSSMRKFFWMVIGFLIVIVGLVVIGVNNKVDLLSGLLLFVGVVVVALQLKI